MGLTVSVVVPCFNASAYLGEALESALGQTLSPAEVIVVDDRSTDDSTDVARRFGPRVRVVELPTNSGTAARPKAVGLQTAQSDLVALLDADDIWTPRKLEMQVPLFADARVGLSYGRAQSFRHGHLPTGNPWPEAMPSGSATLEFYDRCVPPNSTVLARRVALVTAGGFDEALGPCEDYDLWLRVSLRWLVVGVPEVLMLYRTHESQLTTNVAGTIRTHFRVERKNELAVSEATGLSIPALRIRSADRVLGMIMAEFHGHRNLDTANLMASVLLDEYPDLDADRRRRVRSVQRRSRIPRALYEWYDRWVARSAPSGGRVGS